MNLHIPLRLIAPLLVLLVVSGCTPGDDPHQWVAREKAKKGVPLKPLPVIKTFETFGYKDQDRRDPFDLSADEQEETASNGPHPDQNRARGPLPGASCLDPAGDGGWDRGADARLRAVARGAGRLGGRVRHLCRPKLSGA